MATVVVDAAQIVEHTQAQQAEAETLFELQGGAKVSSAPKEKAEAEEKPEEKKGEVKADAKVEREEDENGLTAEERQGLTDKMLRAIGKKHRALREAEEFAASQFNEKQLALKRADQLEAELRRAKVQQAEQPKAEESKPKREKYETQEAFDDALLDWKVDQRLSAERESARKQAEDQERAAVIERAKAATERARELVPDWQEVIESADLEVPGIIQAVMLESEKFAELGLHFAQHPEEMRKLAGMRPERALVEFGKIEDRVKPFVEGKPSTKAPDGAKPSSTTGTDVKVPAPRQSRESAPIVPLNAGSAAQVEPDPRTRSYEEEREAWRKRSGVNLLARKRH